MYTSCACRLVLSFLILPRLPAFIMVNSFLLKCPANFTLMEQGKMTYFVEAVTHPNLRSWPVTKATLQSQGLKTISLVVYEQGRKTKKKIEKSSIVVSPKRMRICLRKTSHKSQLLYVSPPQGGWAKNMYTHVHYLSAATPCFYSTVVHKLRNKPKFKKPHEEINVCSLWANLHGAPPRKETSLNSGKLITLGRGLCLGHCCFALGTQILSLDSSLGVTGPVTPKEFTSV